VLTIVWRTLAAAIGEVHATLGSRDKRMTDFNLMNGDKRR